MKKIKLNAGWIDDLYPAGKNVAGLMTLAKKYADALRAHDKSHKNVNIFCRGSSGAMIAALFASHITERDPIVVHIKKDGEYNHGGSISLTNWHKDGINIIVDDFMSSGETVNKIYERVNANRGDTYNCLTNKYITNPKVVIDYLMIHHHIGLSCLNFKPYFVISD